VVNFPHIQHRRLSELSNDSVEICRAELSEVCRLELPDHLSQNFRPELHTPQSEDWITELPTYCTRVDREARERSGLPSMTPPIPGYEDMYKLDSELLMNPDFQDSPMDLITNTGREIASEDYSDSENPSSDESMHQENNTVTPRSTLARLQTDQRLYMMPSPYSADLSHTPSPMQVSPVTSNMEITRHATLQQSDISPIEETMSPHQPFLQYARQSPIDDCGGYYASDGSFCPHRESSAGSSTAESSRNLRAPPKIYSGNSQLYSNSSSNSDSVVPSNPYHQIFANDPFVSRHSTASLEVPWDGVNFHRMSFDHDERYSSWYRTPSQGLDMFENSVANRPPDFQDTAELLHEHNRAGDDSQHRGDPYPINGHTSAHVQPHESYVPAVQYPKKKCKFCNIAEFTGK
jgi:hypothetical protein